MGPRIAMAWFHRYRLGFRSKNQLPLILFWVEYYDNNFEVDFARILWRLD
jgi:hypothetical protein